MLGDQIRPLRDADHQAALQAEHERALAALREQTDAAQAETATAHAKALGQRDDQHAAALADASKQHNDKHAQLLSELDTVRAERTSLAAEKQEHHDMLESVNAKLEQVESEFAAATAKLSSNATSSEELDQVRKDLQAAQQELADKTEVGVRHLECD